MDERLKHDITGKSRKIFSDAIPFTVLLKFEFEYFNFPATTISVSLNKKLNDVFVKVTLSTYQKSNN